MTNPLKIDLCSYDGPGDVSGPSAWLRRIAPAWRSRGHEVRIRLFTWSEPGSGTNEVALRESGFEVAVRRFGENTDNVRWLLDGASVSPPDVFLANHVVPAHYAASFLRRAGIPGIGVIHSDDVFYQDLTERFVFGPRSLCLSGVVGVSRFLTESVASRDPTASQTAWIPTGTPLPPKLLPRPTSPLRLAYVGRFVEEQKRFRETVEALVRTSREIPGTEAVLYGDGPERSFLEERLLSSDASAVSWGGSLAPHEIPARLQEAHAIILLSDYEGTPTALMEGMAAGCVPVCSRIRSGIPELIHDGVNGLLVDDRGNSFVSAIRRLHEDPSLRERLALAARRRIEEDYSLDVCADRWVDFLTELHAAAGPKRPLHLPRFLHLPKPLPGFAHQDLRLPGPFAQVQSLRRVRFHLGRWRRRLFESFRTES